MNEQPVGVGVLVVPSRACQKRLPILDRCGGLFGGENKQFCYCLQLAAHGLASFLLSFFLMFGLLCFLGMAFYEHAERNRAVYAVIDLVAVHEDAALVSEVEWSER